MELTSPTVPRRSTQPPPPQQPAPPPPPPPPSQPTPSFNQTSPTPTTSDTTNVERDSELVWGSFHCKKYSNGSRCDICSHMTPTDSVKSFHFGTTIKVHGHLAHDFTPPGKIRWFVYQIVDVPCHLIYIGSTISPPNRWSSHKSSCNSMSSKASGLSKHVGAVLMTWGGTKTHCNLH